MEENTKKKKNQREVKRNTKTERGEQGERTLQIKIDLQKWAQLLKDSLTSHAHADEKYPP